MSQDPRGFTLVELVLVLVVMGIFASSVVVSLRGRLDDRALELATKDLTSALRAAQRGAKHTGVPHRLAFDSNHSGFRVEKLTSPNQFSAIRGNAGRWRSFSERVQIKSMTRGNELSVEFPQEIVFVGAERSPPIQLTLKNRKNHEKSILVFSNMGLVEAVEMTP